MRLYIAKIPGVPGFIGTTYAVFSGEKCLKIFLSKKEAENYIKEIEK